MYPEYKEIKFSELEYINNLEYHRTFLKLTIPRMIKLSKKVITRLKNIFITK